MKLPNAERAVVDIKKLRDYCLSPVHPRGRHKARMFQSILGLSADDAEALSKAILAAVLTADAAPGEMDEYGSRYTVDFHMDGPTRKAAVRTAWIVRTDEDFPRLTSCYIL